MPLPKVPSAPAYPRERRVPHLVMPPPRRRYRPSAHHRDQKHGIPTPCLQEVMEWTWECVCVYCSTYYKAVRVCGGGTMEDMCYERLRVEVCVCERVLFIGTQFSILYTSMYSPAGAASLD